MATSLIVPPPIPEEPDTSRIGTSGPESIRSSVSSRIYLRNEAYALNPVPTDGRKFVLLCVVYPYAPHVNIHEEDIEFESDVQFPDPKSRKHFSRTG